LHCGVGRVQSVFTERRSLAAHGEAMTRAGILALLAFLFPVGLTAAPPEPTLMPLVRTIDLNVGEAQEVELAGGKKATVKLLDLKEARDELRGAVRTAEVTVEVNGKKVTLVSANYRLPVTVAGVRIDCPVTKGFRERTSTGNVWGLDKDARLRLWPEGSPLMNPVTFRYPARQRWFASATQMANEPVHVDGGEVPGEKPIYYHYGLDIGGARGSSRSSPRPTARSCRRARRRPRAPPTRRPSPATTWSTSATRGAGTTATATCTPSTRPSRWARR
jgi:hypothetical protein